jgi:hypothetical protein
VPSVRLLQVWVGGLHPRVTEKHLRACFSVVGEVEYVKVREPPAPKRGQTHTANEEEFSGGEASVCRMHHRAATLGWCVCAGEKATRCSVFSKTELAATRRPDDG